MRTWLFIAAIIMQLVFLFIIIFKKSNHNLPGYILIGVLVISIVLSTWCMMFPRIKDLPTTGQFQIGYEQTWYTDTNRIEEFSTKSQKNRELNVAFWYPKNKEENHESPVLFFSHGSFGVKESNVTLYRELASHGYVVVAMDHTYHAFSTKLKDGSKVKMSSSFMNELMKSEPQKKLQESYELFQKWMKLRMDDISFVMDTVLSNLDNQSLDSYHLIDKNKIIVMGHSLGGSAALGIGRIRNDVEVVIALESPFLYDIKGVRDEEYIFDNNPYPTKMLNIYSDSSYSKLSKWKQYRTNYYYLQNESEQYKNIYLKGYGHIGLTDFARTSPFLTMCLDGKAANGKQDQNMLNLNKIILEYLTTI